MRCELSEFCLVRWLTLADMVGRRDRLYCGNNCSALASYYRRKSGAAPPPRWQHPAFGSASAALRGAAAGARQLGESHGWSPSTVRCAIDGLMVLLDGRPAGERVTLTEIRMRTPRHASTPRVAEVLAGLGLPNRRITLAGHRQRLGELTYRALRAWLDHRRATWPRTPNGHVLISRKTALGAGPVSKS